MAVQQTDVYTLVTAVPPPLLLQLLLLSLSSSSFCGQPRVGSWLLAFDNVQRVFDYTFLSSSRLQ